MNEKATGSEFVPFKARPRGDRLRVQLEVEVRYDLDEAAAALAIELPVPPRQFGSKTARRILRQAARKGVTGAALGAGDPKTKQWYRKKLVELGTYSGKRGGGRAKAERRAGWVATRMPDGGERLVFKVPTLYDLDQAAAAMAIQLPEMSWQFGKRTIQATLHDAAASGVTGRALRKADAQVTALYREKLLEFGVFEAQG